MRINIINNKRGKLKTSKQNSRLLTPQRQTNKGTEWGWVGRWVCQNHQKRGQRILHPCIFEAGPLSMWMVMYCGPYQGRGLYHKLLVAPFVQSAWLPLTWAMCYVLYDDTSRHDVWTKSFDINVPASQAFIPQCVYDTSGYTYARRCTEISGLIDSSQRQKQYYYVRTRPPLAAPNAHSPPPCFERISCVLKTGVRSQRKGKCWL